MALITVSNLIFSYEGSGHTVFDHTSFQLDTAWRLGLIGRNGKGKTTLLKLLMGKYTYSGTITTPMGFGYFPFSVKDKSATALSVALEAAPQAMEWELERELAWLDVVPDILHRPYANLSNGEQTKLMLAALFLKPETFLLIDEPTNHLDNHGRRVVSSYLYKKKGFILVSHDRTFLDTCIDHVMSINKYSLEIQRGTYSSWKQNRDYQDQFELGRQEKLQRDVKHLKEAAERAATWSNKTEGTKYKPKSGKVPRNQQAGIDRGSVGHKAAKMMKRSKTLERRRLNAVEEKASLLRDLETAEPLTMRPLIHHADLLVDGVDLSVWHDPDRPLFTDVHFQLRQGQRLAIRGRNGCGKSSLLQLVLGQEVPHTGQFRRASNMIISHVSQDLSWMQGTLEDFARDRGLDEHLFRAILSRLDLPREYWREDMRHFSDGQRKKTALACSLSQEAHLYVWDEPLNFMDVVAREQIEAVLVACQPTLLVVEHDEAFLDNVATDYLDL